MLMATAEPLLADSLFKAAPKLPQPELIRRAGMMTAGQARQAPLRAGNKQK